MWQYSKDNPYIFSLQFARRKHFCEYFKEKEVERKLADRSGNQLPKLIHTRQAREMILQQAYRWKMKLLKQSSRPPSDYNKQLKKSYLLLISKTPLNKASNALKMYKHKNEREKHFFSGNATGFTPSFIFILENRRAE